MVFNIFLLQTFLNILHLNLCGEYMPKAVWIRVKFFSNFKIKRRGTGYFYLRLCEIVPRFFYFRDYLKNMDAFVKKQNIFLHRC